VASSYYEKALGNGRSTRIRFFYLGMSQLQTRQTVEARGALNQALTDRLQEPRGSEPKRALADMQKE
jgi:hypothetical protein